MADEKKVGGDSVVSHNQSGGITAHTVNVSTTPEPTVHAEQLFLNRSSGAGFHSRVALRVESQFLPANLFIAVYGQSVRRIELQPQRTGMVMFGHCGERDGMAFANLMQPFGLVHLDVYHDRPERLRIEWDVT